MKQQLALLSGILLLGFITWSIYFTYPRTLIRPVVGEVRAQSLPPEATGGIKPPAETVNEQIKDYIIHVFGKDSTAAFILLQQYPECRENQFLDPNAVHINNNGTHDVGIFQINLEAHNKTMTDMQDYHKNIDYAYQMFSHGGWGQWTCSYVLNIKSFWEK